MNAERIAELRAWLLESEANSLTHDCLMELLDLVEAQREEIITLQSRHDNRDHGEDMLRLEIQRQGETIEAQRSALQAADSMSNSLIGTAIAMLYEERRAKTR